MALVNAENGAAILTIAKNGTNNSAPLVNGALDTQLFNELLAGAAAQNTSNYIRDYTAAVLGLLAGTVTLPLGPVVAVGADQAFSNTFKWAYDSARQWSQQLDWSKLWDKIDDLSKPANFVNGDPITGLISPTLGTTPDPLVKSIKYVPVDPLILDLDGDGLEITPLSAGVLFDANADTVKTGTAWAAADDGMLVWDRNGNGSIDSGRELFGDETILANGQKAANGFAALAELDTGSLVNGVLVGAGDGKFDANDAQYTNLRVWRDLNQDGISQAGELQTLTQSGVQSISLSSTASSTNYANGNATLVQSGSFTRTDGSAGQAGSFILAQDNFTTSFTPIAISAAASALANIGGSGWVRGLQEAATLSPELIGLFNNVQNASTRAGYKDGVAALIKEWGADSAFASASDQALAAGYGLILSEPLDAQEAGWMDVAIKGSEAARESYRATLAAADLTKFDAMRERMVGALERTHAYEAFTGYTFLNWAQVQGDALNWTPRFLSTGAGRPVEVWVPFSQVVFENRNAVVSTQPGYIRVLNP